jgi:hypothetical protein
MAARDINGPEHWRNRGAEMRALAITMTSHPNDLAADYEKLADRAAIKASGGKPPSP